MNHKHLSRRVFCFLMLFAVSSSMAETPAAWPFFAFDNGVGRGMWPPAVQAKTAKSPGYDGIHYNYTNPKDFAAKIAACKAAGVPIHAMYIYTFEDKPGPADDPGFKEAIRNFGATECLEYRLMKNTNHESR